MNPHSLIQTRTSLSAFLLLCSYCVARNSAFQQQVPVCAPVPLNDGTQGQKGDQGVPGKKGPVGSKGIKGEPGVHGDEGIAGLRGVKGSRGERGFPGYPWGKGGCPGVTFHLPRHNQISDYVRYRGYVVRQTEGTVCAWTEINNFNGLKTIMSYAVPEDANELLLGFTSTARILFESASQNPQFAGPPISTDNRYHVCAWYSAKRRQIGVYTNARQGQTLAWNDNVVRGGGTMLLGQEQDAPNAGNLDPRQSFSGNITNFMIWPRVLSQQEINNIARNCECPYDYSLVMSLDKAEMHGAATYSIPDECPTL